jgi:1-acyl-sn-glycerol-3-phosphate acyltransferase
MIVAKTVAPVVPVRVSGSFQAFPRGTAIPYFVPVTVTIGSPVLFEKTDIEDRTFYQKTSDRIMNAVAAL